MGDGKGPVRRYTAGNHVYLMRTVRELLRTLAYLLAYSRELLRTLAYLLAYSRVFVANFHELFAKLSRTLLHLYALSA